MNAVTIMPGDCLDVVRGLADNSIDSVVTDPPYALTSIVARYSNVKSNLEQPADKDLSGVNAGAFRRLAKGFMGKEWDTGDVAFAVEFWAEVLRVLKPGGHVAAFGGTRSYHRLACAIEDAGFEIRDQLAWCYGTGFPKSHDVSKGIDKAAGAEREVVCANPNYRDASANAEHHARWNDAVMSPDITIPATEAARQWEGWGTALKPAWEPICLARKPLSEKTVAANVLRWGTGAINVDATRIQGGGKSSSRGSSKLDTDANEGWMRPWMEDRAEVARREAAAMERLETLGRWPANLCHDGSPEVLAAFPETGKSTGGTAHATSKFKNQGATGEWKSAPVDDVNGFGFGDSGSAARFFYCAKASRADRAGSKHPTVKPVKLMQWLVRLITPPGGTVLDPFAGTGTTGEACHAEGFAAVLIEREAEYQADIKRRMTDLYLADLL